MKKIGVVVADERECKGFLMKLGKCEYIDLYEDFCVKKFVIDGAEIYFAQSGVGEIRAAIAVQRLVDNFKVDTVLNFGVAGGLKKGTRGNVYIITGVVHYDFDTTPLDGAGRGKYEIFSSPVVSTDAHISDAAKTIMPSADLAVCASGDKFISDPEVKEILIADFGASVCEMEAAGVMMAAKLNGVPFGIIKTVSDDDVDPNDYIDFLSNMTDKMDDLLIELIKRY